MPRNVETFKISLLPLAFIDTLSNLLAVLTTR
jgi:hypothetical protein